MIERLKECREQRLDQGDGRIAAMNQRIRAANFSLRNGERGRSRNPGGSFADEERTGSALDEMRFPQKYTDHIARMAVVGANKMGRSGGDAHRRNRRSFSRNR